MRYLTQRDIGLAGLALLRTWLDGNQLATRQITRDLGILLHILKHSPATPHIGASQLDVVPGYAAWAATYDRLPNLLLAVEQPIVTAFLEALPAGRALDAGCGTGRYSSILHTLGHSVIGLDLSAPMLRQALANHRDIALIQGDLPAIPLHSESMDLVICGLALTHLPDLTGALAELRRTLRPGGHIVISDIHPLFVCLGFHADFRDQEGNHSYIKNNVHLHSSYLRAFRACGLSIVDCAEPPIDCDNLPLGSLVGSMGTSTVRAALHGLPLAVVWLLRRSHP